MSYCIVQGDRGTEEELLEAWVEYLLDEEVYVPKDNESSSKVAERDDIDVEIQINEVRRQRESTPGEGAWGGVSFIELTTHNALFDCTR